MFRSCECAAAATRWPRSRHPLPGESKANNPPITDPRFWRRVWVNSKESTAFSHFLLVVRIILFSKFREQRTESPELRLRRRVTPRGHSVDSNGERRRRRRSNPHSTWVALGTYVRHNTTLSFLLDCGDGRTGPQDAQNKTRIAHTRVHKQTNKMFSDT